MATGDMGLDQEALDELDQLTADELESLKSEFDPEVSKPSKSSFIYLVRHLVLYLWLNMCTKFVYAHNKLRPKLRPVLFALLLMGGMVGGLKL